MENYKPQILEYEARIQQLVRERSSMLGLQRLLTRAESDRLSETAGEIEKMFENEAMLLWSIVEERPKSTWDVPVVFQSPFQVAKQA